MTVIAAKGPDEAARLRALRRYAILDTAPDIRFDRLVQLAHQQFSVPIALISLIDERRQWFKARIGIDVEETDRDVAFCSHTILGDDVMVVCDATRDPRFATNPLVTDPPAIRFYAGAPLISPDGYKLGTLCLVDFKPRPELTEAQRGLLAELAAIAADYIEMRYATGDVLTEVETRLEAESNLAATEHQLRLFIEHAPAAIAMVDGDMRYLATSRRWRDDFRLDQAAIIGRSHYEVFPEIPERWKEDHRRCLAGEALKQVEDRFDRADGSVDWLRRELHPWREPSGAIGGLIMFAELITEQKRAAAELERYRGFLEAVLDSVQDGIVACDTACRLLLFNRATREFHGTDSEPVPPEEWAQRYDLYEADGTTPLAMENIPLFRAFQGEVVDGQEIVISPKGQPARQVVCRARPMYESSGRKLGAVVWMNDVTRERAARESWREAESRYRALFDQAFQLCVLVDANGIVLEANDAAVAFAGVDRGALVGRPFWMGDWWRASTRTQSDIKGAVASAAAGQFVRFEVETRNIGDRPVRLDLSVKPIKDNDEPITMMIVEGRDITEKLEAEEKLLAAKEQYQSLYNKTPVMLHSIDSEGRLLSVSDFWLEKLGYARGDVIGRKSVEFLTSESRRYAIESVLPAFMQSGVCKDVEYQIVTRDGRPLDILLSAVAERDPCGTVKRSMAVLIDVTERKAVERQLVQAQKMQAVGQLTGGLAHDFNNLLGVILGNLELLEPALEYNPEASQRAKAAIGAVEKGAELTRRLLAFARRQKLETVSVDANALLSGMVDLLQRTLGEVIELHTSLRAGLPTVRTDPSQLESAILNLAVNARDAMPDGGRLIIETDTAHLDDDYAAQHPEVTAGDYVVLSVTDTGTGVPPEHIDSVFEPFFTTKEVGKGSGLGLSMVYGFIKQSAGHVRLHSQVGKGTTVQMYLPVDIDDVRHPAAADAAEADIGGRETILVTEDNEMVREVTVALLQGLGYTVVQADSGPKALEVLRERDDIDLLFTDIVMPGGLDGTELANRARVIRPALKIVYTTGYAEAAVLHAGNVGAATNLVSKPYDRSELDRKIRLCLDGDPATAAAGDAPTRRL